MTPDQAPNACPFCGAARKPACRFEWFQCGTMTAPGDNNRRDQTTTCATAERERLVRTVDTLATKATALAFQVHELTTEKSEARAEALVHLGNKLQAEDERDAALARVKRLEEAGNELEAFCSAEGALRKWRKAKEATP